MTTPDLVKFVAQTEPQNFYKGLQNMFTISFFPNEVPARTQDGSAVDYNRAQKNGGEKKLFIAFAVD